MRLVEYFPDVVADLPAPLRTRAHWRWALSPDNAHVAGLMEVLRELPGFTTLAPRSNSKAGWRKAFSGHMGVAQIAQILRQADEHAGFTPVTRKPIVGWRDAFGPNEAVQRVRPRESHGYIANPHRGTTTFQMLQGDETYPAFITSDTHGPLAFPKAGPVRDNMKYIARTTLAYCRWPWSWLEPRKGEFKWALVDRTLRAAHRRGQTVQMRFQPYTMRVNSSGRGTPPLQLSYNADEFGVARGHRAATRFPPQGSVNVPDWYWDRGGKWIDAGPLAPKEPDGNDPHWIKHFGDFIRAFARRYDGHPDIESIDLVYGGFWGEGGGNCSAKTAANLADVYIDGFRRTPLLAMLGTPGCVHAAKAASRTGRAIGWRADSFGDLHLGNSPELPSHLSWNHMLDVYPREIQLCGVKDAWKTAPVTMETSGNVATWVMDGYDLDRIIEEGYRFHMSVFVPKSVFFPESTMDRLVAFDRKIGYRFVLRQMLLPLDARPDTKIVIETFIDNIGCAPIYRPYKLALRFKQGKRCEVVHFSQDIRAWLPGHHWFREALPLPTVFERGEVKVALGIVDEANVPRVWFAIDAQTDCGWHPLTSMDCLR